MEQRVLFSLEEQDIGTSIRVYYTQVEGIIEDFNLEHEDEVKIVIAGSTYYLPGDYPFAESILDTDYDPAVLTGVVNPWSPL